MERERWRRRRDGNRERLDMLVNPWVRGPVEVVMEVAELIYQWTLPAAVCWCFPGRKIIVLDKQARVGCQPNFLPGDELFTERVSPQHNGPYAISGSRGPRLQLSSSSTVVAEDVGASI